MKFATNNRTEDTSKHAKCKGIGCSTCGILRFCQLRGGGAFWPIPRKQGYGYRIDLKFATNNGTDDTSKHAKFKGIGCSTFRDMTPQKFPFQKRISHRDSIFTPWNRAELEKITFYA